MKIFLSLLIIYSCWNFSKASDLPNRETRAVWITTNYSLDWPPKTYDEKEQKKALRYIFKRLSLKYFNTVYFQVRSNGTVCYNSDIEPFSPYFTGEVGVPPDYDPLEYAIELGKEYNIEVHAWINMIRCFSGTNESFLKHPKHVRNLYPELTSLVIDEKGSTSYWMNPGYYRAQDYLIDLLIEITNKYDIDGIQLDFFRYPGKKFEDEDHFQKYKLNMSLGEWRRNNLTLILRKFKEMAKPLNPYLKIGVTPIGIRKNLEGAIGWEGYFSAFQDTERWLEEELVDYLAPQIYWNFEENPRFDVLADEWATKSHNKNIVIGLAAYKSDVRSELHKMIELSRELGVAGVSIFRYKFIADSDEYFKGIALPEEMPWKDQNINREKSFLNTALKITSADEILISWNNNQIPKFTRAYALLNNDKPIKLFNLSKNKLKLKFANPYQLTYDYKICRLDRLWNYTAFSKNLEIPVPYLYDLKLASNADNKPILLRLNDLEALLSIFSHGEGTATIDFYTIENNIRQEITSLKFGYNIVPITEDIKLLSKVKIRYGNSDKLDELNFIN